MGDVIMITYLIDDIVNGERMIVYLHSTLDDTLRQPHIDVTVINHRIGQERVDDAFQIAHTAVGCAGNIADDILESSVRRDNT